MRIAATFPVPFLHFGGEDHNVTHLRIRSGIKHADIPHEYVRRHMGPVVVRGLWYPFVGVGHGT